MNRKKKQRKRKPGEEFNEEDVIRQIKKQKVKDGNYLPHVQKIVSEMFDVYGDKPERMIPIYDIYGNLLWPKQMSYEEVKKFVEERDKEKKADE